METLTSLPGLTLFGGAILLALAIAGIVNVATHTFIPPELREGSALTAAAYMTALGSLFAILTGFLINTEYTTLRQAQNSVGSEVAAASRLAYSTEGLPAADAEIIQGSLLAYLTALDRDEWRALSTNRADKSSAFEALKDLQKVVFSIASREYTPSASTDGMQEAIAELTATRSLRVAISSQSLPAALLALSVVAGLFLIVNALAVTLRSGPGYTFIALGIVVAVALDLAAIIAVSAPFRGPFQASREPIQQAHAQLKSGQYLPWIQQRDIEATNVAPADACNADRFGCVVFNVGEPVELGALLWVDSQVCCLGIDALVGLRLAIDYLDGEFDGVNGKLLGHDVVLVMENDGCDATQGQQAAERLSASPNTLAVIGTTCSGSALDAADRVLSDVGVLLVSPSNTAPRLTEASRHERFYFRTAHNDKIQGAVVADFASQSLRSSVAATIDDGSEYSSALAEVFAQRFSLNGGNVSAEAVVSGTHSVEATVDLVEATSPDVIFLTLYEPTCHEVVRAIRSRPALAATRLIVSEACQETSFLREAGLTSNGVFASGPDFQALRADPFYDKAFLPAYVSRYGERPPSIYHSHAFDAANLVFGAVRRVAVPLPGGGIQVQRSELRRALLAVKAYPGVSGTITCRPTGDCALGASIAIYEAPAWPVGGGAAGARSIFSQTKTLAEVETGQ